MTYLWNEVAVGDVLRVRNRPSRVLNVERMTTGEGDQIRVTVREGTITAAAGAGIRYGDFLAPAGESHFAVCAGCGDAWPCSHRQAVTSAQAILEAESRRCGHCGRLVTSGQYKRRVILVDSHGPREVLYHGRKGPCSRAAERLEARFDSGASGA